MGMTSFLGTAGEGVLAGKFCRSLNALESKHGRKIPDDNAKFQ
jgi:hypothetical protein